VEQTNAVASSLLQLFGTQTFPGVKDIHQRPKRFVTPMHSELFDVICRYGVVKQLNSDSTSGVLPLSHKYATYFPI
jgi:hypothetical protein